MRPPETVYRGERLYHGRQSTGVRVHVNGNLLTPHRSQKVHNHSDGFEWGYGGSGPAQLALALVLDATADQVLTERTYHFVMWAAVSQWYRDTWRVTAGEVRELVEQALREQPNAVGEYLHEADTVLDMSGERPVVGCAAVQRCRVCACTDFNCEPCFIATGSPCAWVPGEEPPLCTRCAEEETEALIEALVREMEGGAA